MQPFRDFPPAHRSRIRFVLTDVDDTVTMDGRLPSTALAAMEALQAEGIRVVPITGRPAGWCDHMARMWPIDALVGENGAFYFAYDTRQRRMRRRYWKPEEARRVDRRRLADLEATILAHVPGCRVSADQAYREADLAIDFCEDVPPLPAAAVNAIKDCFEQAGARAKISSIHVNGWFGDYDKLAMTRRCFQDLFATDVDAARDAMIFVGDSPNDAPMFAHFTHSVGVANVRRFADRMDRLPAWVTENEGGRGFAEMVGVLLDRS
ncbi:MAG: HAD-IIB family hydrolase [Desulfobacterales bacterium]|nr:HAD-IIB family hydrolase [Desulfobacterales bacterium]